MQLYLGLYAFGFGAFLAGLVVYALGFMPPAERRWFLTWVMALVLFGFIGFPLVAGDTRGAYAEGIVLIVLMIALTASWVQQSEVLLARVYVAHGAWDLFHLLFDLSPANPEWIHQLCVSFDWLLAAWIWTVGAQRFAAPQQSPSTER